jgi:hypothetical protein
MGASLPFLFDPSLSMHGVPAMEGDLFPKMIQIRQFLRGKDWDGFLNSLGNFLGTGRGLTPAGDDFIEGLLLAVNRWREIMGQDGDWDGLNQKVTDLAKKRTTTLSANLIEWACRGQADDRLVKVLDAILTGGIPVEDCTKMILSIGHSSGVDALVGVVIAMQASNPG